MGILGIFNPKPEDKIVNKPINRNEDKKNVNGISSNLKIDNFNSSKSQSLLQKRMQLESQPESQLEEEKERIKKFIKESYKILNELEIIEKYINELKEYINNNFLSNEQEINENNIRGAIKETILSYYKENESILESFIQGLEQNVRNYIKNDINNLEND